MKTLLSKLVLGMLLIGVLGGCAGLRTSPQTDAQMYGPTSEIPI